MIILNTQQTVSTPSAKQLIPSHRFSPTFYWAAHQPQRMGIPIQTCNFDMREDANSYTTSSFKFRQKKFVHAL